MCRSTWVHIIIYKTALSYYLQSLRTAPRYSVDHCTIYKRTNTPRTTKMQVTLVLSSLLLAVAVSAYPAQGPESKAVILSQEKEVNFDGNFKNKFETDNGIKQEEVGYAKPAADGPVSIVQGTNSYVAPDGSLISLGYTADEFGYHPYGAHLPTSPPIPAEIQESLKLLASLPSTPEPQYQ